MDTPISRQETHIQSDLSRLSEIRTFVRQFCSSVPEARMGVDETAALELAVDEAASNIMKHAYHGREDQWIDVEAEAFPGRVCIKLHDTGDPFEPSLAVLPGPDGTRESGYGMFIISQSVDEVHYY